VNSNFKLEHIDTEEKFHALEAEWNPLLEKSQANNIYLTWEWISTWWQCFGKDNRLWVLIVRDTAKGEILGIAPLYLHRPSLIPGFPIHHRELSFLGTNAAAPDHLDFIARKGYEETVIPALLNYVNSHVEWDILRLDGVPETALTAKMLTSQDYSWGNHVSAKQISIAHLPETWEIFFSNLRRLKKNLRRFTRFLEEDHAGQVKYTRSINETQIMTALMTMLQQANQVRESHQDKYSLNDLGIQEFHQQIAMRFHKKNWLRIYCLNVGEKDVAVSLSYYYNNIASFYQGGYDMSWSKYGPGHLLQAYDIQQAIKEGIKEGDFSRGRQTYKKEWTDSIRTDLFFKFGYSAKGKILILLYSILRSIRNLLRQEID
jgi:CelD/BcsL family acetyltransferase involved in cellulose biosynthesis